MKLSEQLKQDHESGDFGNALKGYAERAAELERGAVCVKLAIKSLTETGRQRFTPSNFNQLTYKLKEIELMLLAP